MSSVLVYLMQLRSLGLDEAVQGKSCISLARSSAPRHLEITTYIQVLSHPQKNKAASMWVLSRRVVSRRGPSLNSVSSL